MFLSVASVSDEETADPACPIGDHQQGTERSLTHEHGDLQALAEACAHITQGAIAALS